MPIANSCFGRCWWYPALIPLFCLHLTSCSCATSLSQADKVRHLHSYKSVCFWQNHSCICAPAVWLLPQRVVTSPGPRKSRSTSSAPVQVVQQGSLLLSVTSLNTAPPIPLVQDKLCPTSPPWGITNGFRLLRGWGKLYFSTCSAETREHFVSHL